MMDREIINGLRLRAVERMPRLCLRRSFLIASATHLGAAWLLRPALGAENQQQDMPKNLLVRRSGRDRLATRNRLVVEIKGQLETQLDENDGTSSRVEVHGKSDIQCVEAIRYSGSDPDAIARHYERATTDIRAGGRASQLALRAECRTTVLLRYQDRWQEFCPDTPLRTSELDLLHTPIFTPALDSLLLEESPVPARWTVNNTATAALFQLDRIDEGQLEAAPEKITPTSAVLRIDGNLRGNVWAAATRLSVGGVVRVTLGSTGPYVSWADLRISERRSASVVEPGFDVEARLRLLREQLNDDPENQRQAVRLFEQIETIRDHNDPALWAVEIQAPQCGFSCIADRRWYLVLDNTEQCVLRLVEGPEAIAQCDVTEMPRLDAGTQLTLEAFQSEITRALGDAMSGMVQAEEKRTGSGLRLLRCVVLGAVDEIPIQWVYCHLSDDSGRRYLVVFTTAATSTDRFAGADEQITDTFQFLVRS